MLNLILFVIPLGLDTFAVSAALGISGVSGRARLRLSLLMSSFEMAMPVVGLVLGRGVGAAIGGPADYVAIVVLAALAVWMLVHEDERETERTTQLMSGSGLALLAIGISISLDELAMGFTIGLLHLNLWAAVLLIGFQAFVVAQIGMRIGARLNTSFRERAEQLAGVALLSIAGFLLVEHLTA